MAPQVHHASECHLTAKVWQADHYPASAAYLNASALKGNIPWLCHHSAIGGTGAASKLIAALCCTKAAGAAHLHPSSSGVVYQAASFLGCSPQLSDLQVHSLGAWACTDPDTCYLLRQSSPQALFILRWQRLPISAAGSADILKPIVCMYGTIFFLFFFLFFFQSRLHA
jgi:hypothetical protein